ncbi:MAG TPA: phosphate signaling complex protein PhoU [Kofleriaceae bacterium]|nr:phosphate signaling complex protein PhoU [Kofleriaceae bacterium]
MSIQHPSLKERLDHDMDVLRRRLRKMADLVLKSLDDAVAAVTGRDRKLAYQVVLQDNRIDVMERHIDRLCQEFLIRHMPVAGQLRFVVAVAKVNSEIERIGDYAEAIARRAVTLSQAAEVPERERIVEMSRISFQMLRQAIQAFIEGDEELAMRTLELDRQVDSMNDSIYKALAHPPAEERDLTMRFAVLGLLNRIERVADRACNVAEEAIYVTRGQVLRHLPRQDFRVLFLGVENDARSQMAEAIARQIAPAHFIFQSAGIRPGTMDPRAVEFMTRKRIDMARQSPKGLDDVGNVEDFHVVVALSHQAEEGCPALPYGAVELVWDIPDPVKVTGTPAEINAAYESVYQELRGKISELVEGLLGATAEHEEDE